MPENNEESFERTPTAAEVVLAELSDYRNGNSDINRQLRRDIEMLSQAIVYWGSTKDEKQQALTLFKAVLFLYFGVLRFRNKFDNRFYPISDLDSYCQLDSFPIAAILLHGSRVLIEFPTEIDSALFDWFMPDKGKYWRYAATHGISILPKEEIIESPFQVKRLKEEKLAIFFAVTALASTYLLGESSHYGLDIALGGAGKKNFYSQNTIWANGTHGYLYVYHSALSESVSQGLLLGIEQSRPNAPDQYGHSHDVLASEKDYSASGGDFFCKLPASVLDQYVGLSELPIKSYYDSFYNPITIKDFDLIKEAFERSTALFDLLPKKEQLHFIQALVSSSGNKSKEDFNQLCNHYFEYTEVSMRNPNAKDKNWVLHNPIKEIEELQNQLAELQKRVCTLRHQWRVLQKKSCTLFKSLLLRRKKLLDTKEKADTFMETVIQKMGYASKSSRKEMYFITLRSQLNSINPLGPKTLKQLLKDFIRLAIRNRHLWRQGMTHSGRACLDLLNKNEYKPLRRLLFSEHTESTLHYKDLLCLVSGEGEPNQKLLCSARYQHAMYTIFEKNYFNRLLSGTPLKTEISYERPKGRSF